jgi:hypothetical protein
MILIKIRTDLIETVLISWLNTIGGEVDKQLRGS